MIQEREVTVIVPAFQEERLIQQTLDWIPDIVDRVLVVDDGSTDDTATQVQEHPDPRIRLIRKDTNEGVGAALSAGYEEFLARGTCGDDIAVVMAGDAQMDPADFHHLIAPLVSNVADYVKGNRLAHADWASMPRNRRWGTRWLAYLTRLASGYWDLMDSQCGYTAITRAAAKDVVWSRLYPRYGYPNHLLISLGALGLRLAQVPVQPLYRNEDSGIRPIRDLPRIIVLLTRGFFWRHSESLKQGVGAGAQVFLATGLLLVMVAVVLFLLPRVGMSAWNPVHNTALSGTLAILGLQSALFGLLLDYLRDRRRQASHLSCDS